MTLKELREKNKLSQAKLAKTLGVSDSTIANIETGRTKISAKISETVKEVYGEVLEAGAKVEARAKAKGSKKKADAKAPAKAKETRQAPAKKEKMSKSELIKKVAEKNSISQKAAAGVVNSLFDAIADTIATGETVELYGFGTFSVKHRDAHQGRNPATGETITIAASDMPVFKAAKAFKEKV